MKRFCLQVGVFATLQFLLFGGLVRHCDVSRESNYLAATADKHRRLDKARSPKIILTGGSNVPFGIQSDRLEQALGRPVVNMGLAAGVGIDFMLNEIKGSLQAGDIVVLSLEYDRFAEGFDPAILQQVVQYRPANLSFLRPKHFKKVLLDRGLQILGGIVRRSVDSLLAHGPAVGNGTSVTRRGFNAWGDLTVHYGQSPRITPEQADSGRLVPDRRRYPSPEMTHLLQGFAEHCQARRALFAFSFPPHAPKPLAEDASVVAEIESALKRIPHLVILDSPSDQTYAPTLFYDSGYHLGEAGAQQRTRQLAASLRRVLESRQR